MKYMHELKFIELYNYYCTIVSIKVATNAAEILDNVEEWPTEVVEQHSNQ